MDVLVAGLGLIGGSMCMALRRSGHRVLGWNRSARALKYALDNNIIDGAAEDFGQSDVVFVALPVQAAVDFIKGGAFRPGAIVSDICGVKGCIERELKGHCGQFRYVGCHPMAGKEVSGIENASADLFVGASMVITVNEDTDKAALDTVRRLTADMGFARTVECLADTHDRKISYTSQLAHIVSNAYVKDGEIEGCLGFTGGSFQDMTRIAGVDEEVWSELYLKNSQNLSDRIGGLITSLQELKAAIDRGDAAELKALLKEGRIRFSDCCLNGSADGTVLKKDG